MYRSENGCNNNVPDEEKKFLNWSSYNVYRRRHGNGDDFREIKISYQRGKLNLLLLPQHNAGNRS
jgi:hypothetical protein